MINVCVFGLGYSEVYAYIMFLGIYIFLSCEQLEKASVPIVVTVSEMIIRSRLCLLGTIVDVTVLEPLAMISFLKVISPWLIFALWGVSSTTLVCS